MISMSLSLNRLELYINEKIFIICTIVAYETKSIIIPFGAPASGCKC